MKNILFALLILFSFNSFAQDVCHCNMLKKKGGTLYFNWGYNFDRFTKSDIHFNNTSGDNYDFTLYKVKAIDRDGMKDIFHEDITIPQYSYRIGYYFNNKRNLGIEFSYDHVKYVALQYQVVHVQGNIRGEYVDKDTVLTSGFVKFEHTNGANYFMLSPVKRSTIFVSPNRKHWFSAVVKPGIGVVFPRSDVSVFGKRINYKYHLAGYVAGLDVGFRYDYRHFSFEVSMKGAFANYLVVHLPDGGNAHHHFGSLEYIAMLGWQIGRN